MRAGKLILGVQALLAARASRSAAPCRSPDEAISPETTSCVATRESARWPSDGPKGREISLPDPPTGSTPCVPSTRLHQTPALMNLFGASARSPHRLLRPPARARERRPPPAPHPRRPLRSAPSPPTGIARPARPNLWHGRRRERQRRTGRDVLSVTPTGTAS